MKSAPAPRIYAIPAIAAPIVAVIRRGPSDWCHVGKWDLAENRFESGGWLHGRIFPRRCDLSPDGRYLCYFAHDATATWEHGDAYVAVSKLPWLSALHAFGTCGTWTRGYHFVNGQNADPAVAETLPNALQLAPTPVVQFASERRRGWIEAPDCPPHVANDTWDMKRNARMQKQQPGGALMLCVKSIGQPGGEFGVDQAVDGLRVEYSLETPSNTQVIGDAQWADWDSDGKLLVATRCGKIQIRDMDNAIVEFEFDLATLGPDPTPAPEWARHWSPD